MLDSVTAGVPKGIPAVLQGGTTVLETVVLNATVGYMLFWKVSNAMPP